MSSGVNNLVSTDIWQEVPCPGAARLELMVANAAIYYELGEGLPPLYGPEKFQLPVLAHLERRFDAIRFRSAVAGVPALVTVHAVTAEEAGKG